MLVSDVAAASEGKLQERQSSQVAVLYRDFMEQRVTHRDEVIAEWSNYTRHPTEGSRSHGEAVLQPHWRML